MTRYPSAMAEPVRMQRRMRRMFGELDLAPAQIPSTDAYETEREIVFEIEAPGFDEKQIDVEVADHTLVVKGSRSEEKEEKDRSFWLHERLESTFERLESTFERRFELPAGTDSTQVKASFAKGVLTVRIPKTPEATPRKVPIAA